MKRIQTIGREGGVYEVALEPDSSLMEALRDAGLPIAAICGGTKSCATCHVYIEEAEDLPEPDEGEVELLEELEHFRPGTSRLSCQIRTEYLSDVTTITLAPEEI